MKVNGTDKECKGRTGIEPATFHTRPDTTLLPTVPRARSVMKVLRITPGFKSDRLGEVPASYPSAHALTTIVVKRTFNL